MIKHVSPGTKIKIYPKTDNPKMESYYISQVDQILDDNTIRVFSPIKHRALVNLHLDECYILDFYVERGIFRCTSKVIGKSEDNNIKFVDIKLEKDSKKIQRRNFFRIDCLMDIDIVGIKVEGSVLNTEEGELPESALVTNISGGGIRFQASNKYEVGSKLLCILKLNIKDEVNHIKTTINLIDRELGSSTNPKYIYRGNFEELTFNEKEAIIKFVFEQQLKRRQK